MTTTNRCACDDCTWEGHQCDLTPLAECPDLAERLDAGATVPAGECPRCGAFAYLTHDAKAIVIVGNSIDGLAFIGPFDSLEWACLWAEQNVPRNVEWNASSLTTLQQYKES